MNCPVCNSINPNYATKCVCGYDFTTHKKALYGPITDMGYVEFFSNSWRTFATNWTTFMILAAIATMVSSALELATATEVSFVTGFIRWIVLMIVWILSIMALTIVAHKTSDGQTIGVWESYYLSLGLFWRYIWTVILYFLIVLGGMFLLIIPGIIWACRYIFAPYLVIMEGIGGRKALSRSKDMTKGRLGGVFARAFIFGLLFFLIITIPLSLLIFLVGIVLGSPAIGFSEPTPEWAQTIQLFGQFIEQSLFVIFNVLLFKSIRVLAINEKVLHKENNLSEVYTIKLSKAKKAIDPTPKDDSLSDFTTSGKKVKEMKKRRVIGCVTILSGLLSIFWVLLSLDLEGTTLSNVIDFLLQICAGIAGGVLLWRGSKLGYQLSIVSWSYLIIKSLMSLKNTIAFLLYRPLTNKILSDSEAMSIMDEFYIQMAAKDVGKIILGVFFLVILVRDLVRVRFKKTIPDMRRTIRSSQGPSGTLKVNMLDNNAEIKTLQEELKNLSFRIVDTSNNTITAVRKKWYWDCLATKITYVVFVSWVTELNEDLIHADRKRLMAESKKID